ncbi:eukaryotic membrane protein family-domain-containing protein [Globomyces pollinis-pini]|nr:eukaryotic membrane protein family-domain-containing protein [Globomyces pollinis-pini]
MVLLSQLADSSFQKHKTKKRKKRKNSSAGLGISPLSVSFSASTSPLETEPVKQTHSPVESDLDSNDPLLPNSDQLNQDAEGSQVNNKTFFLFQLWEYFTAELTSSDPLESHHAKEERIKNFLGVPKRLEKLMFFGYLLCLDSFIYIFTILPLRIFIALYCLLKRIIFRSTPLKPSQKTDLIKGFLILSVSVAIRDVDASRLYHSIRGQAIIKLYVIFNMLEIGDKLCSAFGHDILDSLFSTTSESQKVSSRRLNRIVQFVVAVAYISFHTLILFYQVMALSVAANSYNNALLTLLLSNQFIEIKGSVFKKFEKANLFQLACADVVERFQLSVFLLIITILNCLEILGNGAFSDIFNFFIESFSTVGQLVINWYVDTNPEASIFAINPMETWVYITSIFNHIMNSNEMYLLQILMGPAFFIFGTEIFVDWLKHAFIVKFNGIEPSVYERYQDSLCRDLLGRVANSESSHNAASKTNELSSMDRSHIVARRIGFVSIPLACLIIRVGSQILFIIGIIPETMVDEGSSWEQSSNYEEDTIGGWKLPNKINEWIKSSRVERGNRTSPHWTTWFMSSFWGLLSFYLWYTAIPLN